MCGRHCSVYQVNYIQSVFSNDEVTRFNVVGTLSPARSILPTMTRSAIVEARVVSLNYIYLQFVKCVFVRLSSW